jgi:hypothetical protein
MLVATAIGILVTVVLFFATGFATGACHCVTPTIVIFPFSALLLASLDSQATSAAVLFLQFPIYAITIGMPQGWKRLWAAVAVLTSHTIAVLVALNLHNR